jgi:quinol monooxygenase YgiN
MHAVVYEVEHKQGWEGDVDAELDMIVEGTKQMDGFVSGTWISDGTTGYAIVLLETEEQARYEAEGAAIVPDASITLRSAKAYEVKRTA